MIPRGRPVISEPDIADAAGISRQGWVKGAEGREIRTRLHPVNPGEDTRLYDLAQVRAVQAQLRDRAAGVHSGQRIPPRPSRPAPHPDDELTAAEAAAELGIQVVTVYRYADDGYLPAHEHYGRRWKRSTIEQRRTAPDGRTTGAKTAPARAREKAVAEQLAAHQRGERPEAVTLREICETYGVGERTASRTLKAAQQLSPAPTTADGPATGHRARTGE